MNNTPTNTAILIFSRLAEEEARLKSWVPQAGFNANRSIAKKLIHHTIKEARATQLPVFITFTHQQYGNGFGERLANAVEDVFAAGYERVITIGNDSPDVNREILSDVATQLADQDLILGPSADNGVYLIGMHKSVYDREQFIQLPWESDLLLKGWEAYAAVQQTAALWLHTFVDLDHATDLQKYLSGNASSLSADLKSILSSYPYLTDAYTFSKGFSPVHNHQLRGPPLAVAA